VLNMDDGVRVEEEPFDTDGGSPHAHAPVASTFTILYYQSTTFLATYFWYLVVLGLGLAYLWHTRIRDWLHARQQAREAAASRIVRPEDLSRLVAHEERITAARLRLQEEYDLKLEKFKEEQAKKEEQKRKELIADWERHKEGKGYRSKTHADETQEAAVSKAKLDTTKPKQRLRTDDYNPLMGGGGGSTYRPSARGGGGGGGG